MFGKHKWLTILIVVATIATMLGACGAKPAPTAPPPYQAKPTPTPEPTATPEPTKAPMKITVATDATWPPFEFVDEKTKEFVGFDIDLMKAIAAEAGFEVEFVNVAWDSLLAGMATGQYDAACSAMTITEERKKQFDFSDPYYNAGQLIAVRVDETRINGPADLAGKVVGAQLGTTGAIEVGKIQGATLKNYDTVDLAFLDLINGQIDAVVADNPLVTGYVAKYAGKIKSVGKPFTDEYYGIAVRKNAPEILAAINKGLKAVMDKGLIAQLEQKWLAAPPAAGIPAPDPTKKSLVRYIEKVDDYTVKIYLNRLDVAFAQKLAFGAFAFLSPEVIKKYEGGGDLFKNPVGTGPFMLKEWIPEDRMTLVPNPNYWGGAPKLKNLVLRVIKEAPARLLELQAGTIDGLDNLAPDDFPTAQADPNLQVFTRPPFNIGYLGINRARPPLDKLEVRQAIAQAINKEAIVKALYPPTAMVATQFIPPGIFGHSDNVKGWAYNPDKAKELLAKAGFPNGFKTTLWVMPVSRGYYPTPAKVGEAIQADLKKVGIDAEIITYDWGVYLDKVSAGEADLFMLGWMADYADATNFLDVHFGKGADKSFGPQFPEIVDLLDKGAGTLDAAERQKIYDQANALIQELVPMVPIVNNSSGLVFTKAVSGIKPSPLSIEDFSGATVQGKDTLIFAHSGDAVGLDPSDETDGESFLVTKQLLEGLLDFEPGTTNVIPKLAEKYEVSADGLEWTFHLRKGVKFTDGTDFNADAVIFNFERWWDKANPYHKGHTGDFFYWGYFFGGFKGE